MTSKEKPLRGAFIDRLTVEFYEKLKDHPVLSEWDTGALFLFAKDIVDQKEDAINAYLDRERITLSTANFAVQEIIRDILMKEISDVRI